VANTIGCHYSRRDLVNGSSATSLVSAGLALVVATKAKLTSAGWLTVIGWIAALTSVCFFVADLTLGLVTLSHPDYDRKLWHGTLLLWAVLLLCVFINVFVSGALPTIEVIVLVIHVLGFFGILIPLVYLTGSHHSAKEIFSTFNNLGGWRTNALAFFIGLQGNALAFVGTDSAVHVSKTACTRT
jgi:choline transport protein